MMTSQNFRLFAYHVMLILSGRFADGKAQIQYSNHRNESSGTSREIYYTTTYDQDISRRGRSSSDLPVAFRAPDIGSQNFWNFDPKNEQNRRTLFEDLKYFNYGSRDIFPTVNSFFEFMSPLFDREIPVKPREPPVSKPSEPYKYENPFKYLLSTEKNFLPPPKPLRASVVKLETITKSPVWQLPFEYITPNGYAQQVSKYPNRESARQPSLHIDELGFNSSAKINFRKDFNFLGKKNSRQTIISPSEDSGEVEIAPHQQISVKLNMTDKSAPKTEQGLVNKKQSSSNSSLFKIFGDTIKKDGNLHGEGDDSVPFTFTEIIPLRESIKQGFEEESKRTLQLVINNTVNRYSNIHDIKINSEHNNITMADNINTTLEIKTMKPYKLNNSIKIVTDLTLEGLQQNTKDAVNVPRYTKLLNMSNLISYELNKLKKSTLMKPRYDIAEPVKSEIRDEQNDAHEEFYREAEKLFNDKDVLSLDLKILKDTNWNGFTTQSVNNYSPRSTYDNSELATIQDEKKPDLLYNKNGSSRITSMQNSSFPSSTGNKGNNENKTIVVETRVTKSITKLLSGKSSNIPGKLNQTKSFKDYNHEDNHTYANNCNDKSHLSNMNFDTASKKMEINEKEDISSKERENIRSNDKDKRFFRVVSLEKTFDALKEHSSDNNHAAEGSNLHYLCKRRKYMQLLRNLAPNNISVNGIDIKPHPCSNNNEHKIPLNMTNSTTEKTSNGGPFKITDTSHYTNIENLERKERRRRKPKRSKSKRRRMDKRRRISTTTWEKLSN